ncbi:hypothetical protein HS088_TW09G00072 [Tripterygium wilfordii]|uniref:Prolamin-like domain-containing protein n=1 Tax=Tripterygium wilfordii TaxID=458696 RepID=A0A7J7D6V9_TRIWF|nr:uncharacterized protein LOC120005419 [Tripterygium wilfordii]KAF5742033.1 hypothetical protein HS088_TW09G00072 [Tripterygium wilfordii]
MMKIAVLLLLLACLIQQALGAANVDADDKAGPPMPSFPWLRRPWRPRRPFFPFPMPPLPAHHWPKPSPDTPKPNPAIQKCFMDMFEEAKCVGEIKASYWNKKTSVGDDCCKIVQQVSDDCANAFNNPYFGAVLKQYCAKKAYLTSP